MCFLLLSRRGASPNDLRPLPRSTYPCANGGKTGPMIFNYLSETFGSLAGGGQGTGAQPWGCSSGREPGLVLVSGSSPSRLRSSCSWHQPHTVEPRAALAARSRVRRDASFAGKPAMLFCFAGLGDSASRQPPMVQDAHGRTARARWSRRQRRDSS